MSKYIHYCWFGGKSLPKLAKKCIKSWKKYLPDYEIKEWNESNVDLEECPFIKEAYENKKWAFVADYVRTKVLKEYGGIYFDTDMEVIKNIDEFLKNQTFLGIEDTGYVAVGVWYEKEKNGVIPSKLLEEYRKIKEFNTSEMSNIAIPKLISEILEKYDLEKGSTNIQTLKDGIIIYPREYFYPYSYNRDNNIFTENTCMIHYYDASWIPKKERLENTLIRKIGRNRTYKLLNFYRKTRHYTRKVLKTVLFPLIIYRNYKRKLERITSEYIENINKTINEISLKTENQKKYIVIHNGDFLGVTSATIELFKNTVDCRELYRKKDIKLIANRILSSNVEQVIFSSFSKGYKELAMFLKKRKKNIKIKVFWHGSHSQILDTYGFERNIEIIKLHRKGIIDVFASCKQSLINFYNKQNFNIKFLTNKVETDITHKVKRNDGKIRIGLYAAKCDDWRKNMFSQMAAVSQIENAVLDMIPLNETAKEFANILGLELDGVETHLKREELIQRMSQNDINMYVTFSECAPMLPLESLEVGVPCITGNNHHYFKNNKLEEYLVVSNEEDIVEIKNKIQLCLKNEKEINELYKHFRKNNLEESQKQVEDFLKM